MNTLVTVQISVDENQVAHTNITCGGGMSFLEVLDGLRICRKELDEQIKNKEKCPFYEEELV